MELFGPFTPCPGKPLYVSTAELIRRAILDGRYRAGDRLPSAKEITSSYQISRVTVLSAIDLLEREGLVESRRGSGVYVLPKKVYPLFMNVGSFSSLVKEGTPASKVLIQKLENGFLRLKRVRGVRDMEGSIDWLTIEDSHLQIPNLKGIEDHDFSNLSLYQVLEEHYGIKAKSGFFETRAVLASADAVKYLNCKPRDPVIEVSQEVFDERGQLIEKVEIIYDTHVCFKAFSEIKD